MQRQRGELVPIGEVVADLDGPVKAIREASPQARHHFTQADQVNQLVSASEADPDLGFMARLLALCSLPRTNPGNRKEYKRVNGPYTLYMQSGPGNKLPFGNLPRLLLAWVSTEAVRTQSRELVLGRSLSKFMRTLGINSTSGGVRGEQTRLRNQMKRLFGCTVSLLYQDEHGEAAVNSVMARRTEFWWNERKPDQPSLWESKIELGEDLFYEIISHPVPIDMNTLTAMKRSPLGLDLYLWLVYRTFPLRAPLRLTWKQVYRQFGAHPDNARDKKTVQNFRVKVLRELKKIKMAWPDLNYTTAPGLLILHPRHQPSHPRITVNWQARAQSSLLVALQAPPYPSRVPDPLKPAPGASYKPIQTFPQIAMIRASFPRCFGRPPPGNSSLLRETPPRQFFAVTGDPYK